MKKKKNSVYLSGPITGLFREEYLARFSRAEMVLRNQGYQVVNPCKLLPCRWPWLYRLMGYRLTLLYDLWHLWHCEYYCMLPGYNQSKGAMIEYYSAYWMGLESIPQDKQALVEKEMLRYYHERNNNGF